MISLTLTLTLTSNRSGSISYLAIGTFDDPDALNASVGCPHDEEGAGTKHTCDHDRRAKLADWTAQVWPWLYY